MNNHIHSIVEQFKPYAIKTIIEPLSRYQIETFLSQKNSWAIALNREKGRGVLYGNQHVQIRQAILNTLPKEQRLKIMQDKLTYFKIFDGLTKVFSDQTAEKIKSSLIDIKDIGKGHGVYQLTFINQCQEKTQWVIKQSPTPYQKFYYQILKILNWPTGKTEFWRNTFGGWECTEYLNDLSLHDDSQNNSINDDLMNQIAKQAALSDCLGRGDRHLDNYIVKNKKLIPVDISFLFWADNESWLDQYLKAGMNECSVILKESNKQKTKVFFQYYDEAMVEMNHKKEAIKGMIKNYFSEKESNKNILFFNQRLTKSYHQQQQDRYLNQTKVYLIRKKLKETLAEKVKNDPLLLEKEPLIKMYYLADHQRSSAFFLLDYFNRQNILEKIGISTETKDHTRIIEKVVERQ